jgi:hypothetical protein
MSDQSANKNLEVDERLKTQSEAVEGKDEFLGKKRESENEIEGKKGNKKIIKIIKIF